MASTGEKTQKTCFIIMPISTPEFEAGKFYADDKNHFRNVLQHLFMPAVKQAGFEPVAPSAEGSTFIQAGIIQQLESADMLLCDISTQNANVYLELGIRIALNKPVALVRDEHCKIIPFDTSILNHHTYPIRPWALQKEVSSMAEHIKKTAVACEGVNPLWKFLGLKKAAAIEHHSSPIEAKLDLIRLQLERYATLTREPRTLTEALSRQSDFSLFQVPAQTKAVHDALQQEGFADAIVSLNEDDATITIYVHKHSVPNIPKIVEAAKQASTKELQITIIDP